MSTAAISTGVKRIRVYGDLVMFSHTLFSLPFALSAMLMAEGGFPDWSTIVWIVLAFTGARTGANALNRLVDRNIDAQNPRTAGRHIPAGIVSPLETLVLAGAGFLLLVVSAFMLNTLCVVLLPIPMVLFVLYSYSKRFTWLCHLILGATCAGASFGGWIAVSDAIQPAIFVLSAANALWVAGFDIIYSCQDHDFDRETGLFSIPVRFGIRGALGISALFHAGTIFFLTCTGLLVRLSGLYYIGVGCVAVLLFIEHLLVKPEKLDNVCIASYSINQLAGPVFFIFTALSIVFQNIHG